ncbi:MAG: trypsin-like serine protease [Acidobacteria bacterium]|nr:trypsin-like serine protease [Acidobacteriota bacterium]
MKTKIATLGLSLGLAAGIAFSGAFNFNAGAQSIPQRKASPQHEQIERLQPVPLKPMEKNDPKAQLAPEWLNVAEEVAPAQKGASITEEAATEVAFNTVTKQEEAPANMLNLRRRVMQVRGDVTATTSNVGADARVDDQDQKAEPQKDANGNLVASVIGADNRVNITDTTVYPWRAITKLLVRWPNGQTGGCSGTMIASRYVLTAGHCVHQDSKGGWASSIEVVPGLDGTYRPYGSAFASYYRSVTAWTEDQNPEADYALLTLDRHIGSTVGWFGYGNWSDLEGVTGHLAGYPGDLGSGREMYYDYDPIADTNDKRLFYRIDTFNGQSGSGVYRKIDGNRYVMGVHAYGNTGDGYNKATRINGSRFDRIQDWIATGY